MKQNDFIWHMPSDGDYGKVLGVVTKIISDRRIEVKFTSGDKISLEYKEGNELPGNFIIETDINIIQEHLEVIKVIKLKEFNKVASDVKLLNDMLSKL
jgi:hypothetical protein